MANNMKRITGTNNAWEYSATISSQVGVSSYSEDLFIPSNVGSTVMFIRRKTGTAKFKVQATTSTQDEIFGQNGAAPAEWFNWDIPATDANGWLDEAEVQWWVPIPSGLRLVIEASAVATDVYFSLRAQ